MNLFYIIFSCLNMPLCRCTQRCSKDVMLAMHFLTNLIGSEISSPLGPKTAQSRSVHKKPVLVEPQNI